MEKIEKKFPNNAELLTYVNAAFWNLTINDDNQKYISKIKEVFNEG
jgi:hypothetical protein